METDDQENLIRRYLLGDLPEAEQLALTQDFFADDEKFEQVWASENELLDRYVRGSLTPAEKELFEKNYLASPVHRQRLAFARTLSQAAASPALAADSEARPVVAPRAPFFGWFGGHFMQWGMAAAALLLVVAGSWLLAERGRLREQMNQLQEAKTAEQQRTTELENRLAEERRRREELAAELARLRQEPGSPVVEPGPPTPATPPTPRSVVALSLSPMMMRGEGGGTQLKIARETTELLLQLQLQEPSARNFRASLRTVEGAPVWSGSGKKRGATVTVPVPAARLSTNDYILTLSGSDAANQPQELGRYFFRIIKP